MATLDSISGDPLDISPFHAVPSAIAKGKEKSLVLWRDEDWGTDLLGSFFDESTLQWGEIFSLGENDFSSENRTVQAAFDGERFLVVRQKEYPYSLEAFWLDPSKGGFIEASKEISPNYATPPSWFINLALACLGVEDCICTFSVPSEMSSFLAIHLSAPGTFSIPEPIYPANVSYSNYYPRSDLHTDGKGYILSGTRYYKESNSYAYLGLDRLNQDGKFEETISTVDYCEAYALSFVQGNAYQFCGKDYLRGGQINTSIKDQEIEFNKIIDRDFPSTQAIETGFWEGDFWVNFTLSRTNFDNWSPLEELWLNRINPKGEVVASHQVPGTLIATGNTRALLSSGEALYLMTSDGSFEKIVDSPKDYKKFLFDGTRFVGFFGYNKQISLIYLEEDGTLEERTVNLVTEDGSSYQEIDSVACGNSSCLFNFKSYVDYDTKILEIPFQGNPFFLPGSLEQLDPQIMNNGKLQFDGESFVSLSYVSPDSYWNIKLNKENVGKSIVVNKITTESSIETPVRFFLNKNSFAIGLQAHILYVDGNESTILDYMGQEKIFQLSQDGDSLLQFYSQKSPQMPTSKAFSTLWNLQKEASAGQSPGGEGGDGGEGGEGGESSTGGIGAQGGAPSSQGGAPSQGVGGQAGKEVSAGGPPGTGGGVAGKPAGEGPPQTQAFSSEEGGGCGCRWGTSPASPAFLTSILAALSLAQRRRRRAPC